MSHIVIIGAGECGARAAFALREKNFDGRITLVGAEEHLPYERPRCRRTRYCMALSRNLSRTQPAMLTQISTS